MHDLNLQTPCFRRPYGFWLAGLSALLLATAAPAQTSRQAEDGDAPVAATAQLTLDDLRTFTDVFNQVRRNYVESVDDKTLLESAIRGMLSDLDPHSSYISGADYQDIQESSEGQYQGIGVDVEPRADGVTVIAVINDSPADRAGINPGDIFTAIDGEPIAGENPGDAIDRLLGEAGTTVDLVVLTPEGEERSMTLRRELLQIPTMRFELLDLSWGYFHLSIFNKDSAHDLTATLDSVAADGIALRGIVIDLRDNPGGVLQGAVEMADGFLDDGLIVSTRGRNSAMQMEFGAHPGQWLTDIPLLVLVDRGTASASEVFAGALQDHGRALIVGERTFGKGSVQSVLPLRNGNGIKLTTARYYTPSGRSIQAEGIRPDIAYEAGGVANPDTERVREADLDRHLDKGSAAGMQAPDPATAPVAAELLEEALRVLEEAEILVPPGVAEDTLQDTGPP
jgi:carboxyl-terminal processing protease